MLGTEAGSSVGYVGLDLKLLYVQTKADKAFGNPPSAAPPPPRSTQSSLSPAAGTSRVSAQKLRSSELLLSTETILILESRER